MKDVNNTCQICGRVIKATTGVIAHHGYQRPYKAGWQTGSCAGARFLPYEISCDRLPPTIETVKAFIAMRTAELKDFIANPPAVLTSAPRWIGDKTSTYEKPEGFDPKKNEDSFEAGRPYTYQNEYRYQKRNIERSIKEAKHDVKYLEQRLADWVPPKQ